MEDGGKAASALIEFIAKGIVSKPDVVKVTACEGGSLLELDQGLDGTLPPRPHGLFWANLLFAASRENVRLPKLKSLVETSIHQADYVPWTHSPSSESPNSSSHRAVCHPLLPLLLFCQAVGPDLPRKPLHDYLLRRSRKTGTWNNPTETALTLLCLLSTIYTH